VQEQPDLAHDQPIVQREGDLQGTAHIIEPVCTHMKCLVHWNALETSWNCPCHGSHVAPDGSVLEGPAYRPLERKQGNA